MNYARIKWHDISNGPGVRASLFVSGCTHGCPGCFNQEAWDFKFGNEWTKEVEDKFIEHLQKPVIAGVNILGGEPLQQGLPLNRLLKRIKNEVQKPIWLWTGYTFENIYNTDDRSLKSAITRHTIRSCDVVVDGQFKEAEKDLTLKYRGSKNQRVIDIPKTIELGQVVELEGF